MIEATDIQWKQMMEGFARGDIPPYSMKLDLVDNIRYKTLWVDNQVKAAVSVNLDTKIVESCDIDESYIAATSYIYIPTPEEVEEWDDLEQELNYDVTTEKIAEKEAA